MSRELVLARYFVFDNSQARYSDVPEDIGWTSNLIGSYSIALHDKTIGINVGREQEAYLKHIVSKYDSLANVTFFSQAVPFPHCPDFIQQFNVLSDEECLEKGYIGLSGWKGEWPSYIAGVKYELERCFGIKNVPDTIKINGNGIFMATADRIRHWPKSSYQMLLDMMSHHSLPLEVYTGENIWTELLRGHFENCRCGSM